MSTISGVGLGERLELFGAQLRYTQLPYSNRQWGSPLHSLCSYQGKLKPGQVHCLLEEVIPEGASVLDPLGGVGTVAFEGALAGRETWSNDLSPFPFLVATGKLRPPTPAQFAIVLAEFADQLAAVTLDPPDWESTKFGLNATVADYFHPETLAELLKARRLLAHDLLEPAAIHPHRAFLWACLLHVLHGNRPYALSRTSHPITPFAPRGEFVAKSVVQAIEDKARRALADPLPENFRPGVSLWGDFRTLPARISGNVDAIVTSPPFLGMRFDRPNWLRLWFCGWDAAAFHETRHKGFLERDQSRSREVYREFFAVCAELLPAGGPLVVHVGAGPRGDLGAELKALAPDEFDLVADVAEDVRQLERHGVSDKQRTSHQHLLGFVRR